MSRKRHHRWRARFQAAGVPRSWIRIAAKRPHLLAEALTRSLAPDSVERALGRLMVKPIRTRLNYKALGRTLVREMSL